MQEAKNLNKEISIKKIDNETVNIKIFNNNVLMAVVGEFNKNLTEIEKLTSTKLFFRGNSITAKGNKNSISNVSNSSITNNSGSGGDLLSIQYPSPITSILLAYKQCAAS